MTERIINRLNLLKKRFVKLEIDCEQNMGLLAEDIGELNSKQQSLDEDMEKLQKWLNAYVKSFRSLVSPR